MKSRRRNNSPPPRGGTTESFEMSDAGEPTYFVPVPPAKSVVPAVVGDRVEVADPDEPVALDPARPLVPSAEELANLPAAARAAFLARCGRRVAPLRHSDAAPTDPQTAAALVVAAALVRTPVHRQLRAIRKDFDRLKWFVRRYNWGDDTPIPPDVFGPLWADGQTPGWAQPK